MATVIFKDPSPYSQETTTCHESDYLYQLNEKHVSLKVDAGSDKTINVALFGLGRAGSIHLSNLARNPRTEVLYIVDDEEGKGEKIKRYWKLDKVTILKSSEAEKVFNDPKVDAVVVASPTYTHEDIVRKSLEKGKAVFCEKPVAGDIASTKRCYEKAKQVGQPLFTAFNRRFDPAYSQLRDRVRKGEVGHVHTIKVCSRDSPLPTLNYLKISGGIYHDCAVHDIDMICWILGEYPTQVAVIAHAHTPEIAAIKDHDTVAIVLKFPSGTTGMIDLSRNSCYGYDMRLEVFGPRGIITCHNERPMSGIESQLKLSGSNYNPIYFSFASRHKLAYQYELEHFLDILQGQTSKPKVEGKEVLAVSKIATACEESAKTGQFITIKWAPEELPSSVTV
uniref:Inositol 2-dehydrogenase n=1 Tax=Timema cristinae TaxID=61476 RepID=A0A7R9CZF5_TIMCR|nr:unnamed protein product [Timema cristinae]